MMDTIATILIFLLFLTPLIFFHELGHFAFARLFGVRVETFSIGFGPKLLKKKWGDTLYTVSAIPLGGYVKMFGDDPLKGDEIAESERKYAFNHKGKWARFWIVFGGPLANFILAFVLLYGLVLSGEKVPEPRVGLISESNVLYTQGIRPGDLLVKINGEEISGVTDIAVKTESQGLRSLTVKRGEILKQHNLSLDSKSFMQAFIAESSPLRKPILMKGDGTFIAVSGDPQNYNLDVSLEEVLQNEGQIYSFQVKRDNEKEEWIKKSPQGEPLIVSSGSLRESMQSLFAQKIFSSDIAVKEIAKDSPAEGKDIRSGDIVINISGVNLLSFEDLRSQVKSSPAGKPLRITVMRGAEEKVFKVVPKVNGENKTIGIYSQAFLMPPEFIKTAGKGFFESLPLALSRTWDTMVTTVIGFKKLLVGEASLKNIGGPIAIGKVASDSFRISLSYFLGLMALVSVNLGIINLFPIPVLDGGHILFIFFEIINGGPLSRRKMEIAQQFGLSVLLLLIAAALINDVTRFF